jgi:gliding motility-associatede transport system auxiliary component
MKGVASLLAALGLVGLVFSLLSLIVVLVGGGGLSSDLTWIFGNLGVGVALLIAAAAANFDALRARMASGEARRAGKYGTSAIASTVLGIAILGMLGFLSARHSVRFDWSEQKVHSLSEQTTKVLAGLQTDVDVLALVPKTDRPPVREFLDRYAYASDRFKVTYADPNEQPGLLEKYGIRPDQLDKGLVRVAIGGDSVEITELTEQNVTNALVKLTRTGEKVVYFLEGHGERAIEKEAAKARNGYARAATSLRNENYRVETLLLAAVGDVPKDADVVIIAGATRPLLDVEIQALERYAKRGGAVFALVDPRVRTNLVELLNQWGVVLGDDVVVDRSLALFNRAMTPFAARYDEKHPITRDMREPTIFHEVRSVTVRPDAKNDFTQLVFTGDSSWAERDLARLDAEGAVAMDDGDLPGPLSIAVVGTPELAAPAAPAASAASAAAAATGADAKPAEPRLAVFGDSDFAANELIEAYRNRDLFVNTVNWLMGDVESISVRPNVSRASRFQLSNEQFRTVRSLSLFVLPEAIAVLGVFMWWSRRHPAR